MNDSNFLERANLFSPGQRPLLRNIQADSESAIELVAVERQGAAGRKALDLPLRYLLFLDHDMDVLHRHQISDRFAHVEDVFGLVIADRKHAVRVRGSENEIR